MDEPLPPPGWYPDPQQPQLLRWWSGTLWWSEWRPADDLVLTASSLAAPPPVPTVGGAPLTEGRAKPITLPRAAIAVLFIFVGGQALLASALLLRGGHLSGAEPLIAGLLGLGGLAIVGLGVVAWSRPKSVNVRVLSPDEITDPWVRWRLLGPTRAPRPRLSGLRWIPVVVVPLGIVFTLLAHLHD